jgi:hypothetical protein
VPLAVLDEQVLAWIERQRVPEPSTTE